MPLNKETKPNLDIIWWIPVYTDAHHLYITFLNEPELICLHTVKWFQVLLSNTNNLI